MINIFSGKFSNGGMVNQISTFISVLTFKSLMVFEDYQFSFGKFLSPFIFVLGKTNFVGTFTANPHKAQLVH